MSTSSPVLPVSGEEALSSEYDKLFIGRWLQRRIPVDENLAPTPVFHEKLSPPPRTELNITRMLQPEGVCVVPNLARENGSQWPLVYSVVLNYRDPESTKRCLESLFSLDYPNHEVVVVSNDDDYEAANEIRDSYPDCAVIVTGENLGFSSGFNVGIRHALEAGAAYVSILNDDVVVRDDFLKNGVATFHEREDVGMVGGKIYKYQGGKTDIFWSAGGTMSWVQARGMGRGFDERDTGQYDGVETVSFIPGAQMLVRREVFEDVGLLPACYFIGGEEWDFALQVRRAGYQILYNSDVVLWHEVGYSRQRSFARYYNHYRNKLIFMKRSTPRPVWAAWFLCFVIYCHSLLLVRYWRLGADPWKMYLAAVHAIRDHVQKDELRVTRTEFEAVRQDTSGP